MYLYLMPIWYDVRQKNEKSGDQTSNIQRDLKFNVNWTFCDESKPRFAFRAQEVKDRLVLVETTAISLKHQKYTYKQFVLDLYWIPTGSLIRCNFFVYEL